MTPELWGRIQAQERITDEELAAALAWVGDLLGKLEVLGPEFRLAWRELRHRQIHLEGIQRYRTQVKGR